LQALGMAVPAKINNQARPIMGVFFERIRSIECASPTLGVGDGVMEVSYFSPIRVQWNDLSGKVRRVATRAHQRDALGALEPSRCSRFPRLASRCASSSPVRARSVENEHSGAALRASGTLRVRDPVVEDVVCSEHSSTVAVEVKLHATRTNWKSEHDLERSAQRR